MDELKPNDQVNLQNMEELHGDDLNQLPRSMRATKKKLEELNGTTVTVQDASDPGAIEVLLEVSGEDPVMLRLSPMYLKRLDVEGAPDPFDNLELGGRRRRRKTRKTRTRRRKTRRTRRS